MFNKIFTLFESPIENVSWRAINPKVYLKGNWASLNWKGEGKNFLNYFFLTNF